MKPLLTAMREGRLYLDGGMGSMLQEAGLPEGRLPDVWGVENPQAVQAIHRAYLEAGCRLITTNTFGTTAPKVEPYGYTVAQVMSAAVANVRAAMDQAGVTDAYVCADIGPTGKLLRPYGDLDFEEAVARFADPVRAAAEAGAALAEETGRLYVTSFSLSGLAPEQETAPVSITFASGGELVCRGSTEVSFPASAGGEEAEQPETPPEPVLPPSTASSSSGTSAAAEEPAPQPSPGLSPDADVLIPLIGLAVLLVAAVAALLLRRKRSAPEPPASSGTAEDAPPAGGPQDPSGIFVRLEVLQGAYLGQRLEFTLQRELVIGRDPGCDIPFADGSVSRRHSRIFLANDVVYIEDLGSQNGTQLNGSRIEMAHILRSGDVITAGDVTFKLKF